MKKRHGAEQIVAKLRQAEAELEDTGGLRRDVQCPCCRSYPAASRAAPPVGARSSLRLSTRTNTTRFSYNDLYKKRG